MRGLICIATLFSLTAWAEIADRTDAGFTVKHSAAMNASPAKVFEMLTKAVEWWDSAHTYSGDAHNMSLDPKPGGCFCERLKDGGIEHMRVIYAETGKVLRLTGALGPLQEGAVSGTLTWELAPSPAGTQVTLIYRVGGYSQGGLGNLAKPVDTVIGEQLARLKAFVEKR